MGGDEEKPVEARRTRMAPAERRAMILMAAAAMFRSHGYAGASIEAIAAAAGISGPGIYRYFNGKTEILLALLERAVAQAMAAVDAAAASDGQRSTDGLADVLAGHALSEGAIIALLQGTVADMDAADRERLERVREDALGRLANALRSLRPDLGMSEAEGRMIAVLAMIGQAERFLATGADAQSFRAIVRSILRI
jgi:AcrR family transcriptional regulator